MRILPSVAGLALLALLLTGCLPQQPTDQPTPLPSSTPVFASDEDALAAAEAAYARYEAEVDYALTTYDTTLLPSVAVGDALQAATESVESFQAKGHHQVGSSSVDSLSLIQGGYVLDGGEVAEPTQVYACLDISATDVVDASGVSVVSANRPARLPVLISLLWDQGDRTLRVSAEEVWDGDDFCS